MRAVPPSPATRLRALYFLYYGNVGTVLPFFAVYLHGLGFSGKQIGLVQMLPSFPLAPIVAVAWATWADHRATPQRALRRATGWVALAVLLLPFARTPAQVAAVVVLTARGGRPADLLLPVTVVLCVCAYALVARGVPATPRHAERPAPREMLTLLRDRRLWILLGPAAIHWAACAPYHVFYGVLVRDLKLPDDVTSAGMATGVVAEILVLLAFPRLERRFPLRRLLAVSFVVSAVRWALLARATAPLAVAGLQALHGLTFGLF